MGDQYAELCSICTDIHRWMHLFIYQTVHICAYTTINAALLGAYWLPNKKTLRLTSITLSVSRRTYWFPNKETLRLTSTLSFAINNTEMEINMSKKTRAFTKQENNQ